MDSDIHSRYINDLPDRFSGLRAFSQWISKLPADVPAPSGEATLFEDGRISWLLDQTGPLTGRKIMELGPFEGGHTYMLHQAGAESIDAIEANQHFYVKCLAIKECFDLKAAHFYLGDFVKWLEAYSGIYQLIVASGVLYHMADPISLLERLSEKCETLFIWTHYAPNEPYPEGHPLKPAYLGVEDVVYKGTSVRLHQRTYLEAAANPNFCGGVRDRHAWLDREGLLAILRLNGFTDIRVGFETIAHPNGPCLCVYAQK